MSELSGHIRSLRTDYARHSLDEAQVCSSPTDQFSLWMEEAVASKVMEANAMHLSTASADGRPSSRIVLLRGLSEQGFTFYTNYNSRKSQDLESNPHVCFTLFWPELERQVRVEGRAERVSAEASDAYFNSRPRDSQIGAWASEQSETLTSRELLDKRVSELTEQFQGQPVPRPPFWGGWCIKPDYFEFWQGRKNRLHDRIVYRQEGSAWKIERLFP